MANTGRDDRINPATVMINTGINTDCIDAHIDVMPQPHRWPLWVVRADASPENTDSASLPLPPRLVTELRQWAAEFPLPAALDRGVTGAEDDFWVRGRVLAAGVAVAVAGHYRVRYFDGRDGVVRSVLTDAGIRIDDGHAVLPSHWRDLSDLPEVRDALATELARELPPGHALEGRHDTILARCDLCDDVLISVDRAYAVVHLTLRRETNPNRPSVDVHTDPGALLADLSDRHPADL